MTNVDVSRSLRSRPASFDERHTAEVVSYCDKVTDAGKSALSAGCRQLQSIDLGSCDKVTDAGISALSAGCRQLQSIILMGCYQVTDAGILALSAGCVQLQIIYREGHIRRSLVG